MNFFGRFYRFWLKHKKLGVLALFVFAVIGIFWPIIFGGRAIVDEPTLYTQYPSLAFLGKISGALLWNPFLLGGHHSYVGEFSYLAPFGLIFRYFNFLKAFNFITIIGFSLGLLFSYIFFRNLSLSRAVSSFAALTYSFSHLNIFWGPLILFNVSFWLLPLLFLVVLKISSGRKAYFWAGVVAIALGWYLGFGEFQVYTIFASLAFSLFLCARSEGGRGFLRRFEAGFYIVGFIAAGTFLALPRLITVYNFLGYSVRAAGAKGETSFLSLNLAKVIFPYFNIPFAERLSPLISNSPFELYVGILPWFLIGVLFLGIIRRVKIHRTLPFFVVLLAVSYLPLFKATHLFDLIYKLTFGVFGGSWKLVFLGNLSLSVLAGFGLQQIEDLKKQKFFPKFVNACKYLIGGIVVFFIALQISFRLFRNSVLSILNNLFAERFYDQTAGKPLSHYFEFIEKTVRGFFSSISFTDYHFLVSILILVVSFSALYLFARGKISAHQFKKTVVAVTAVGFVLLWQGFYSTVPNSLLLAVPKTAEFLKVIAGRPGEGPARVFRFWPGLSKYGELGLGEDLVSRLEFNKELLTPNLNTIFGIEAIDGDAHFMSDRQSKISATIGSFRSPQNDEINWLNSKIPFESKLSRFQSPENRKLLSMMNVKYLLTSFDFKPPLKRVYETKVTSANIPVFVYENPDVLPRVYFAQGIKFIEPNGETAFNELLATKNFKQTTLIECLKPECVYARYQSNPSDILTIEEIKSGYLKVKTSTKYPRWLIYSESNLPTWEVRINDNPELLPIHAANYLFQAVYIPPGDNTIVFSYPGIWKQTGYSLKSQISKFFSFDRGISDGVLK